MILYVAPRVSGSSIRAERFDNSRSLLIWSNDGNEVNPIEMRRDFICHSGAQLRAQCLCNSKSLLIWSNDGKEVAQIEMRRDLVCRPPRKRELNFELNVLVFQEVH